ncbi:MULTISPECIES: TrbC/VirB2 family protein [unclassified Novosphingobium]|uniref:TrbC/VirB2 family protein n=1 Tax=unclassified Novosphingobium TaxID=2644732 RepID=UPI0025F27F37|nr:MULTISPECIES: TrbC/VirB2 family protein [unclassified Novosphingobium]HQV02224.1 TrbC/VirB2 family protein [Novosphingobium sp.]
MNSLLAVSTLSGPSQPLAAVQWVADLLLGPFSTAIAVIAVAGLGLSLLGGRLPARRGVMIVLGCFILFGAPSIARELMGLAGRDGGPYAAPDQSPAAPIPPPAPLPPQPDPYAGAAMPNGQ